MGILYYVEFTSVNNRGMLKESEIIDFCSAIDIYCITNVNKIKTTNQHF